MRKLSYHLDRKDKNPLYVQLYQQIRQDIHQERLKFGDKLPSKRMLRDYLQISQNTVESAYGQLLAEGYIEAKPGSGFFVCFQVELKLKAKPTQSKIKTIKTPNWIFDLNPNAIDTQHFPYDKWKKCGRFLLQKSQQHLLRLGAGQGELALRQEIVNYLQASRGIDCDVEQIIVAAGVESCMQQLILLFNQQIQHPIYAMETYGYEKVRQLLKLYQQTIVNLPLIDNEQALDIANLKDQQVNIAFITPSNLYPFASVLSIGERQDLLEWASSEPHRYIIEDDYDSEFRYKGKPIPALQSLDHQQKVIYLGSFSKLIMPALRIAFMVLPKNLLSDYQRHCGFFHSSVSRLEQLRLANFMQQGEFERHIQRMRTIYRKKMELLCQLLAPYKEKIHYHGEHSGFHLLIDIQHPTQSAKKLAQIASQANIKVYPIDIPNKCLIALGFGHLSEKEITEVVERLLGLWKNCYL